MNRTLVAMLKSLGVVENITVDCAVFDIGRSRNANHIIPHVNISRNHCQLTFVDNEWKMEDLSSSGTYVNDELIGKGNVVNIQNNDVIRLGPKDCNFTWQFITDMERVIDNVKICNSFDSQTLSIEDICMQRDTLERRMLLNRQSYQKMILEKENLLKEHINKVRKLEEGDNSEGQSTEINHSIKKNVGEEKKKIHIESKLLKLQEKINENCKVETQLKQEIQKLQERLILEQCCWKNRFIEETKKLEEKVNEQKKKLETENLREISHVHEQELENKLKKKEEEERLLMAKLREIEDARDTLWQKLNKTNELLLTDEAEKMKNKLALPWKETDSIQSGDNKKLKVEERESTSLSLLEQLDQVKHALIQSQHMQNVLELKLAEASFIQDKETRIKSNLLDNIADLMESELQCSICSELFVTAITLNCTHTFCKDCINRWKKKKKTCPICRKRITSENRSIVMDNYIDKMVENLSSEFKTRRRAVIAERNGIPERSKEVLYAKVDSTQQHPVSS